MKKIIFPFLVSCFVCLSSLQAQIFKWAKEPSGSYTGSGNEVSTDANGNVYVAGTINGTATFGAFTLTTAVGASKQTFLAKYDSLGVVKWAKLLDSTVTVADLQCDAAGNFVIAGVVMAGNANLDGQLLEVDELNQHGFIAKYTKDGVCQWIKTLAVSSADSRFFVKGLALHASGQMSVTGYSGGQVIWMRNGVVTQGNEMFLLKCNASGSIFWISQSKGMEHMFVESNAVTVDASGNSYVTGSVSNEDFESEGSMTAFGSFSLTIRYSDVFVAKYDPSGNCVWVQKAGSSESFYEGGTGIAVDQEGNSYVAGSVRGDATFGSVSIPAASHATTGNMFLAKYSTTGQCVWVKKMGGNAFYYHRMDYDVACLGDNVYLAGPFWVYAKFDGFLLRNRIEGRSTSFDVFVAKFQTDGTFQWATHALGEPEKKDNCSSIAVASTNKIYIAGSANQAYMGASLIKGPAFVARLSDGASKITGTVFSDLNGNGLFDSGETPAPQTVLEILPGPTYTLTDSKGFYQANILPGTYTVRISQLPAYYTGTVATHSATFTDEGQLDKDNNFAILQTPDVTDGRISFYGSEQVRPGFETNFWITYQNEGTMSQSGTGQFTLDSRYEYLSSTGSVTQSGNTLTWNYTDLKPNERRFITVKVRLPVNVALGTILSSNASLAGTTTDVTPTDNALTYTQTVIGSFDPNDKAVSTDTLSPAQVQNAEWLTYTIRFQNKGTAEALFVTLKDTLSNKLDIGTFEMIAASHAYDLKLSDEGVLKWFFDNINLPAERADEPGSHGFVQYRIKPKTTLALGEVIENEAYIYFDYNDPVLTNTVTTRVSEIVMGREDELALGEVKLYPNPTTGNVYIELTQEQSGRSAEVSIYNYLGGKVTQFPLTEKRTEVDTRLLRKGRYIAVIKSGTRQQVLHFIKH